MRPLGGFGLTVVVFALGGCGSMAQTPPKATASAIVYACPDGQSVRATYSDTRTAVVEYRGTSHTLKTAVSADGARYVGDGLQWWTKGMTRGTIAALAPGETYAPPGEDCVAPGR